MGKAGTRSPQSSLGAVTNPARFWWAILLVASTAVAIATGNASELNVFDPTLFTGAARQITSGQWATVFADPDLQVGPILLVLFGIFVRIGSFLGLEPALTLSLSNQIPVCLGIAIVAHLPETKSQEELDETAWQRAIVAGCLALVFGLTWTAFQTMQPADAFVPMLWALAAKVTRRKSAVAGGIVIGLAAGLKLWGLLGLPILLLDSTLRRAQKGAVLAAAVSIVPWLPFIAFGRVGTFDFRWPLWDDALLGFLSQDGIYFSWWMRLVQALLVLGVGTLLAVTVRERKDAWWAVPAALLGVKILFDPSFWYWYWLGMDTLLVLGLSSFVGSPEWGRRGAILVATIAIALFLAPGGFVAGGFVALGAGVVLFTSARLEFPASPLDTAEA